jgi:hypothetical protein
LSEESAVKKILALTVAVLIAALAFGAAVATEAQEVTLTGWIVDQSCGKANANPAGKDCVLSCNKSGSPLVLSSGDKLYLLSDQKTAVTHVGYPVVVTGKLDAKGGIKVASITKAPKQG